MNQTAFPPPPKGFVRTTVSMLFNRRFMPAGTLLSVGELRQLPQTLVKERYLIRYDPNAHQTNGEPRSLTFGTNVQYSVDSAVGVGAVALGTKAIYELVEGLKTSIDAALEVERVHDKLGLSLARNAKRWNLNEKQLKRQQQAL